jgi:hypothetical protein
LQLASAGCAVVGGADTTGSLLVVAVDPLGVPGAVVDVEVDWSLPRGLDDPLVLHAAAEPSTASVASTVPRRRVRLPGPTIELRIELRIESRLRIEFIGTP